MIYKRYDLARFKGEFVWFNRDVFSPEAYELLFDFLEEQGSINDNLGYELDVIEIVTTFSEAPLSDVLNDYGLDSFEELEDNTLCWLLENGNVLFMDF